jgi:hypothetical protein
MGNAVVESLQDDPFVILGNVHRQQLAWWKQRQPEIADALEKLGSV